ncbi:TlpA family protein disulfide reductase [Pseudoxanthomonas sp. UTMC 1351]|uniref:TlpA family protein disulfide reductase n=1 Tax=Pseudoxanthomonas sp. UTMC 1351 TaxID=2695853 RepID=UPI0034CF34DD
MRSGSFAGALLLPLMLAVSACQQETPAPAASPAPEPSAAQAPAAKESQAAEVPALSVETVEGFTYDLAAHRGKWVVVNFWATWCAPCLKEMPELSALDAMHEHIEVIGLAYEEIDAKSMRDFLSKRPVVYPIAIVDVANPPADFATPRGLPMTYLIAPDGKVAQQFLGPVTAGEIEAAIAAAGGPKAEA